MVSADEVYVPKVTILTSNERGYEETNAILLGHLGFFENEADAMAAAEIDARRRNGHLYEPLARMRQAQVDALAEQRALRADQNAALAEAGLPGVAGPEIQEDPEVPSYEEWLIQQNPYRVYQPDVLTLRRGSL